MAVPEDVRQSRGPRRTIVQAIGIAATALTLGAGTAGAQTVELPGLGAVEIPDAIHAPALYRTAPGHLVAPFPRIPTPGGVLGEMRFGPEIALGHPVKSADHDRVANSENPPESDQPESDGTPETTPPSGPVEKLEAVAPEAGKAPDSAAPPGPLATPIASSFLFPVPLDFSAVLIPPITVNLPGLPQFSTPAAPARSSGELAVDAARRKIGSHYGAGSTGPDSFDCSGLVQWSYEQAGVDLPRTSYEQLSAGTPVARDDLAPGDLVSYYGGGHSALYAGDGKVIHAATDGTGVIESPLDSMPYAGARRY